MRRPSYVGALLTSAIIIVLAVLITYFLVEYKLIPGTYENYLYGVVWLVASVLVTHIVSSRIRASLAPTIGAANASSVAFVARLVGYIIAIIGFLAIIRVSIAEALAAGGFTGLVLGLASQFVLSNIIGGVTIIVTKPYRVGDRITFTTWQYGLLAPAYPPKFFSQDFLVPGYTGVVTEITLMYTVIRTDGNIPLKVPNSIMAQAAIFVHSDAEYRVVRTKYEVPKDLDPDLVIQRVKGEVSKLDFVVGEPSVQILDTSQTTYVIAVDAACKSSAFIVTNGHPL
ncbi:MAG: mechanosensitive ion channel [Acidilobus sp.]|nr:mechanosensitive ion channel [Acidilobus sp.]